MPKHDVEIRYFLVSTILALGVKLLRCSFMFSFVGHVLKITERGNQLSHVRPPYGKSQL
jgi:hypothetical protein